MSTIGGGGGRINRPPEGPALPTTQTQKPKTPDAPKPQGPNDGFERNAQAPVAKQAAPAPGLSINVEKDPKFNELLKQTRNDPKALNALAHTLNMAYNRFNGDFQADRAKASTL